MSDDSKTIEGAIAIKNQKESYEENVPAALKHLQKLLGQSYPHKMKVYFDALGDNSKVRIEFPMDINEILKFSQEYAEALEKDYQKGYWS